MTLLLAVADVEENIFRGTIYPLSLIIVIFYTYKVMDPPSAPLATGQEYNKNAWSR